MRKKILSLALALAVCLGLTIPAFAVDTRTESYEGIPITAYAEGSIGYVSYAGPGELYGVHADWGFVLLDRSGADIFNLSMVYISVGEGLTVTDEFIKSWNAWANNDSYGFSVSFNDSNSTSTAPAQPQKPAGTAVASPTNDKLTVNGNAADPTVYKINDSNYFKIRDVAALLNGTEKQFAVGYDSAANAVTATTGEGYDKQSGDLAGAPSGGNQDASLSNDAIYVNGQQIEAEVYKIDGSNYFKLRDLGKALNFYVGWSADRGMYIETDKPYSE